MLPKTTTLTSARFNAKRESDAHRTWTGGYTRTYGQFWNGSRPAYAHRFAYEQAAGEPIPPRGVVGHVCDTPSCTNADGPLWWYTIKDRVVPAYGHLWLGTYQDNFDDMVQKGRERLRGVDSPRAKLTEELVRYIRVANPMTPATQRHIAAELNVSWTTVYSVVRRMTWQHIV